MEWNITPFRLSDPEWVLSFLSSCLTSLPIINITLIIWWSYEFNSLINVEARTYLFSKVRLYCDSRVPPPPPVVLQFNSVNTNCLLGIHWFSKAVPSPSIWLSSSICAYKHDRVAAFCIHVLETDIFHYSHAWKSHTWPQLRTWLYFMESRIVVEEWG